MLVGGQRGLVGGHKPPLPPAGYRPGYHSIKASVNLSLGLSNFLQATTFTPKYVTDLAQGTSAFDIKLQTCNSQDAWAMWRMNSRSDAAMSGQLTEFIWRDY